jgi:hypothetical protein
VHRVVHSAVIARACPRARKRSLKICTDMESFDVSKEEVEIAINTAVRCGVIELDGFSVKIKRQ